MSGEGPAAAHRRWWRGAAWPHRIRTPRESIGNAGRRERNGAFHTLVDRGSGRRDALRDDGHHRLGPEGKPRAGEGTADTAIHDHATGRRECAGCLWYIIGHFSR